MTLRRSAPLLASATLVMGTVTLTPGPAGGQAAECTQPYSPVAFAVAYPNQEELPEVPGDDVTVPAGFDTPVPLDSDGDGATDVVTEGAGQVRIGRGDGTVVLTVAGASLVQARGVGDIDGDGRGEILVAANGGADEGTYLVPGTVPATTQALTAVGTRLADGGRIVVLAPDRSDRLVVVEPIAPDPDDPDPSDLEGSTRVLDAGDTLAAAPGDVSDGSSDEASYVGLLEAFAADRGDDVLTLVVGRVEGLLGPDADRRAELLLARPDGTTVRLTTAPRPLFPADPGPVGGVAVVTGPDGTFVRLGQASRSGAASYLWSLDDPCTPYAGSEGTTSTTVVTTPRATPATPVTAAARFTG